MPLHIIVVLALIYGPATLVVCLASGSLQVCLARKWLRQKRAAFTTVAASAALQMLIPFVAMLIAKNINVTETREQFSLPLEVVMIFSVAIVAEAVLFALSILCLVLTRSKTRSSQPSIAPYSEPAARFPQG